MKIFVATPVFLKPVFGRESSHTDVHTRPIWKLVSVWLGEPALSVKDVGAQLDNVEVVVSLPPIHFARKVKDRVGCRSTGDEIKLGDGRIERSFAAGDEEDRDL